MLDLVPLLVPHDAIVAPDHGDGARAWAESGAMPLTGRRNGPPLLGPVAAAPVMHALADVVVDAAARLGRPFTLDGPALLGERAAFTGHRRQGEVSVGGTCRLLPARGGWIALSLPRPEDRELLPAWLPGALAEVAPHAIGDADVARAVASRTPDALVHGAAPLGLPCSAAGEHSAHTLPAEQLGEASPVSSLGGVLVVDLSSLWAGPLCAQLLAHTGATVVKVESVHRPDGARRGPAAFYDLLHAGTKSVALDFRTADGRAALRDLVARADVVIEASRPRALQQLGIDARAGTARVWLSITGHGRDQPLRTAFGDDAAVAGGLLAWDSEGPVFAADAAADPAAGLLGAAAVLHLLGRGGRWLVDLALAGAAALLAAAPAPVQCWEGPVAAPRARPPSGRAPALGEHTAEVLAHS